MATKKTTTKRVAQAAARRSEAVHPDMFPDVTKKTVKEVADRAAKRSTETRAKADAMAEAAAHVDPRSADVSPEDYVECTRRLIDGIRSPEDVAFAQRRWEDEVVLRQRIGLDIKQARLLKAGLDGRCNRVKHGDMKPRGRTRAHA